MPGQLDVTELYREMYQVVRAIPPGKVLTYGQVAEMAGAPGASRAAGAAMRAVTGEMGVPWHRVIGKRRATLGYIAILDPVGGTVQRQLLEAEGVEVKGKSIDLSRFGWLPRARWDGSEATAHGILGSCTKNTATSRSRLRARSV